MGGGKVNQLGYAATPHLCMNEFQEMGFLSPPVIFIAGRPKAALLFWFFGDFRCGALLFMVIHVIYKYKNK